MAFFRSSNGGNGSGSISCKKSFAYTLPAGAANWTDITSQITEDGILCIVCIDNYNMQWQNITKGTSGNFTNQTTDFNCAYTSFEVSTGDTVKIKSNSSVARHIIGQIVGQ